MTSATISTGSLDEIPDEELSQAEWLAKHGLEGQLTQAELREVAYSWEFWGRPDQQWPEDPDTRILGCISGRGAGKTRTGSEHTRIAHRHVPQVAIGGATYDDVRKYCIEGEAGILRTSPKEERPKWEPGKKELTWPNGCKGFTYAGTEPDRFRGASVGFAWLDEFASWQYPLEAFDNLTLASRAIVLPGWRIVKLLTTTPKPVQALLDILQRPGVEVRTVSTYRNRANLPDEWLQDLLAIYEGTKLGDQELHGVFLGEVEGALWTPAMIQRGRITWDQSIEGILVPPELPELRRIAIGVDPPGRSRRGTGAECGIVVVGREETRPLPTGYVLGDYSLKGRPSEWAMAVKQAMTDWGADRIYVEDNAGSPVSALQPLEQVGIPASMLQAVEPREAKAARAEPVSMLSEKDPPQMFWFGTFAKLEAQCTTWVPTEAKGPGKQVSPDRMDAFVHAATELGLTRTRQRATISSPAVRRIS